MLKIYIYGCSTCGVNSVYVRKVQAYGLKKSIPVEIINSKYNTDGRTEHSIHLMQAGLGLDNYDPIVVEGTKVTLLKSWS